MVLTLRITVDIQCLTFPLQLSFLQICLREKEYQGLIIVLYDTLFIERFIEIWDFVDGFLV